MESSSNINATMSDANDIIAKLKNSIDGRQRISTKLDNNKFQVTISPFPGWNQGRDADTSSIEYEHILKDENGQNINNAFVEAIQRKREQRGNACNKCAIF